MKGTKNKSITDKPKDFKNNLKKLLQYLKPYYIRIIIILIMSLISTIFTVLSPKILGDIITNIYNNIQNHKTIDLINFKDLIIILIIIYLLSSLFRFIMGFLMSKITANITYRLRSQISEKLNKLPLKYFDNNSSGDILSKITNDVDTITSNIDTIITEIFSSFITIVGIFIMMIKISGWMTLTAVATLPISVILIFLIASKSQKHFDNQQKNIGKLTGYITETYSAHNIVKVYNGEEKSIETFNNINNQLKDSSFKSEFYSGLMMPIIKVIGNFGYVIIVLLGGFLAVKGRINIGDIPAFIQYVRKFNHPILSIASTTSLIQAIVASAERVLNLLEEPEEEPNKLNKKIDHVKGKIEFKKINFGYQKDINVIKDFNVVIKPGTKVAIVGPTGAGKTTIVNLLMRFYELNSGKILIDGVDIKEMEKSYLRSLIGMVLQDTWIFNGTIKENIAYGKLDACDNDIIDAAKLSYADHFINTLPNGYNMIIDQEVSNISAGEKQLLTIARTFLSNPKILILDEATSSIDTRSEILITKAFEKLMKNKTTFVIAHRLSTIKNADMIIVMDQGKIVEIGKHEELLAKRKFYYNLYNSQFDLTN
ncbi:MAG: ABC transporter ATP-binding protein [Tenericutes bacterium]|jgi:ATP-binding cassette subfamily B protein|nr:ABC transporter ATP-binding protein [Mycoplasmatota bacterium]